MKKEIKNNEETTEETPEEGTTEEEKPEEGKEEGEEEKEEKPEEGTEEGTEEEKPEETEGEEEKAVEGVAKAISKYLDLDGLKKKIDAIKKGQDIKKKIFGVEDTKKETSSLTKEEKIVGFFSALLTNDTVALKALGEGVGADGGFLVPDEFRAELIKDLPEVAIMRSLVRVVPMKRDVMNIPKLGSRPQVRWTAENAAKSTTTADFEQKQLHAYKVANIIYISDELIEDATDFDVVKMIIDLFAERIAEEEDKVITQGSGTGQPTGLTNCAITNVACSGNLSFNDIINLIYALPAKYRKNAKFLVNNINIRELRKLQDSTNRYIWLDNVVPGQPATIHGYPVIENNWLPESEIYFGDYKLGYWLGDKKRITVTVSNLAGEAWEKDQVGIRVVERIGGNCVLENAIRCLNQIP